MATTQVPALLAPHMPRIVPLCERLGVARLELRVALAAMLARLE